MGEIQKADPKAVRVAGVIIVCAALLGVVLINISSTLHPEFEAWVRQDVRIRVPLVIAVVTFLTAGPVLAAAGYLWHFGQRMIHSERYPPPGFRMVRDTPIVTGDVAIRQGRLVRALAGIMGVTGLLLVFFLWRLFVLLGVQRGT